MEYCVQYALNNRLLMALRVKEAILEASPGIVIEDPINIAHNYARMEKHYGHNVMVHRKGATSAREGEVGIIPGSQGANTYIVRGKGCRESFMSCSHGAGRKMGRKEAQRQLTPRLEEIKAGLAARGIVHSIRSVNDLDEAPEAYKDIECVMAQQTDLVDIVHTLSPIAVLKG
jgi:tRNA-splicing ligase RtcB